MNSRRWIAVLGLMGGLTAISASLTAQQTEPIVPLLQQVEWNDTVQQLVVFEPAIATDGWDTLAPVLFWKSIMQLEPERSVLNVAKTRQVLEQVSSEPWTDQSDLAKDKYRDSLREYYCLEDDARIFLTSGKQDFYRFDKALPSIHRGVELFINEATDPWYAQAILLIESPGRMEKSPVGALGSFQLMRSVAQQMGLVVNRSRDDRKDFDKSAVAAAKLLRTICIPETERLLERHNITYCHDDLWFRLMVLHVYHAGAGNVGGVLNAIKPTTGGIELIQSMWVTEHGRFRNASQNYSQVALASIICMQELIQRDCLEVCTHPSGPLVLPLPADDDSELSTMTDD